MAMNQSPTESRFTDMVLISPVMDLCMNILNSPIFDSHTWPLPSILNPDCVHVMELYLPLDLNPGNPAFMFFPFFCKSCHMFCQVFVQHPVLQVNGYSCIPETSSLVQGFHSAVNCNLSSFLICMHIFSAVTWHCTVHNTEQELCLVR